VLEKRTSLDISPDDSICFTKNFDIGFDINYLSKHKTYFGYILRIISNEDHNIDLIYHQKSHTFRVINGEIFSNVSFQIDSPRLYREWNRINLKFNLENQTIRFEVNGKLMGTCNTPLNFRCFKFLWGANDYLKYKTRDIPPMQLKDIKIYENLTSSGVPGAQVSPPRSADDRVGHVIAGGADHSAVDASLNRATNLIRIALVPDEDAADLTSR